MYIGVILENMVVVSHMVVMMVWFDFDWHMNCFNNGFCVEVRVVFDWYMNPNPFIEQTKQVEENIVRMRLSDRLSVDHIIFSRETIRTYFEWEPLIPLANKAIKIMNTAMVDTTCKKHT